VITEKLLDFFFAIASGLLSLLPSTTWDVNTSAWQYFKDILNGICYFLPLGTVTAIITLIISLTVFRIFVSFVKTIWGYIPFV